MRVNESVLQSNTTKSEYNVVTNANFDFFINRKHLKLLMVFTTAIQICAKATRWLAENATVPLSTV